MPVAVTRQTFPEQAGRETGPQSPEPLPLPQIQMQVRAGLKLLNYNKRVIIMCAYEHNLRAIWHELAILNVKSEMISVHRQHQTGDSVTRWSLFLVRSGYGVWGES